MSFAALCMLAESRGWVVVIAVNHQGPNITSDDEWAYMRTLAIYESRAVWRLGTAPPIVAVRLDEPRLRLNEAASAIENALHATGVV